ncbi:MAG: aminotransferase class V-fold PLP-dependent enzyme, partial [Cellvibrionaceae bacterium]|nr:aminotransferase class V-fold PLP-dependent enzyme [Cellvibrionaceae bacterium]
DAYRQRPFKLASFSAASNVTGIKAPIAEINKRLKAAGVWSCWDYAAAAPYVGIDMSADGLDAVYISPHKFIGGPGSPGVLLLNQAMVKNSVPSVPGGGTVSFVSPEGHRYLNDIERREEGGTPAIVESIRAGLAFALQQKVGTERIEALEQAHLQRAIGRLKQVPEIELLGNLTAPRLAIIALRIKHRHEYLHYGFAVALLNDLFGIQVRGGCSCAGPYGHQLLGLSRAQSKALDSAMAAGQTLLRPGWLRFNLNYFIATEELDYILSALELVAQEGWRLLPYYQYISEAGVWAFQGRRTPLPASLEDCGPRPQLSPLPQAQPNYEQLLASARTTLLQPQAHWRQFSLELPEQAEALRWFSLPQMPA